MVVEMLKEDVASKREGVMTERIAKLRMSIIESDVVHDTERLKILMEVYGETNGEPPIIRRAKLLDRVMTEKTIYIDENPIVGTIGRGRNYYYSFPELSATWMSPMTSGFQTHKKATGFIEKDKRLVDDAVEYWYKRYPVSISASIWNEMRPKGPDSKTLLNNESFSCFTTLSELPMGLPIPDWSELLSNGLNLRIAKAEKILQMLKLWDRNNPKLHNNDIALQREIITGEVIEKYDYYRAVIIALRAIINNAHRYATLAKKMARKETDPQRQQELLRIAETCRWVPAKPPRNFYEAVQFHWFIIAAALIDEAACGSGPQGFSLYMNPYYKKDIDKGRITREEAIELLEFLFLKYKETGFITDMSKAKVNYDQTSKYITNGGLTEDKQDPSNEIDSLILETQRRLCLPEPGITLL